MLRAVKNTCHIPSKYTIDGSLTASSLKVPVRPADRMGSPSVHRFSMIYSPAIADVVDIESTSNMPIVRTVRSIGASILRRTPFHLSCRPHADRCVGYILPLHITGDVGVVTRRELKSLSVGGQDSRASLSAGCGLSSSHKYSPCMLK